MRKGREGGASVRARERSSLRLRVIISFSRWAGWIAIQGLFHREHRAKCDQSRNDSSPGTNSKVFEGGVYLLSPS